MRLVWASSYRQHACRISAAGSDHTAEGNARRLHQKVFQKPNARPRTLSIVDGGLRKKRSFLAGRGTSAMETLRSVRLAPCRGFQVCALLESGRVAAGVPSLASTLPHGARHTCFSLVAGARALHVNLPVKHGNVPISHSCLHLQASLNCLAGLNDSPVQSTS